MWSGVYALRSWFNSLTHFILDTPDSKLVKYYLPFLKITINSGSTEKYFTESCSEGSINCSQYEMG